MKRNGFTLVELLIVTVVIVTLMGITFRLAGLGGESKSRSVTIQRLQRVEFALSGYYAAFGSYPPVPVHGYRSIYKKVNAYGVQYDEDNQVKLSNDSEILAQVKAACKSQPVAVMHPYDIDKAKDVLNAYQNGSSGSSGSYDVLEKNPQRFSNGSSSSWTDIQLFKFGLLSFLMPRYFFMLEGDGIFFDHKANAKMSQRFDVQWRANNSLPCSLVDGRRYSDWKTVRKHLGIDDEGRHKSGGNAQEAAAISNILSQAVCARWMESFRGIVAGGRTFFGVDTWDTIHDAMSADSDQMKFAPGDADSSSSGQQYILDGMTVKDGWGREFFYYSPAPYQTYQLWSAGADGKTFPPWIDLESLDNAADRTVAAGWIADDIKGLSN